MADTASFSAPFLCLLKKLHRSTMSLDLQAPQAASPHLQDNSNQLGAPGSGLTLCCSSGAG